MISSRVEVASAVLTAVVWLKANGHQQPYGSNMLGSHRDFTDYTSLTILKSSAPELIITIEISLSKIYPLLFSLLLQNLFITFMFFFARKSLVIS